jgi:hypothetical protein
VPSSGASSAAGAACLGAGGASKAVRLRASGAVSSHGGEGCALGAGVSRVRGAISGAGRGRALVPGATAAGVRAAPSVADAGAGHGRLGGEVAGWGRAVGAGPASSCEVAASLFVGCGGVRGCYSGDCLVVVAGVVAGTCVALSVAEPG